MKRHATRKIFIVTLIVLLVSACATLAIFAVALQSDNKNFGESIAKYQVSLNGRVNLRFVYSSFGTADAFAAEVYTPDGNTLVRKVGIYKVADIENNKTVSVPLAPSEMTHIVRVYPVSLDSNGEVTGKGDGKSYSVREYALAVIARDELSEYHSTMRALLNWGAMSQGYFGDATDSLANTGIYTKDTNPIDAVGNDTIVFTSHDPVTRDGNAFTNTGYGEDGNTAASASLLLARNDIALRFYIYTNKDNTYSASDLTATINRSGYESAKELTVHATKTAGKFYVEVTNISVTLFDKVYDLNVTAKDGSTLSVSLSVLEYLDLIAEGKSDTPSEEQKATAKALYQFYTLANAEVHSSIAASCQHGTTHWRANGSTASYLECSLCFAEIKNVPDSIKQFYSAQSINTLYNGIAGNTTAEIKADSDGTIYSRLYGGATNTDKYNDLRVYSTSGEESGRYIVFKYRVPTTQVNTQQDTVQFYIQCGSVKWQEQRIDIHQDNEWHTVVIDLSQFAPDVVAPGASGKYYAQIWFRPLSASGVATEEDYMDMAYFAYCDDLSTVSAMVDEVQYERYISRSNYTDVTTATNVCADNKHLLGDVITDTKCTYVCQVCDAELGEIDITDANYFRSAVQLPLSDYSGGHFAFTASLKTDDGDFPYASFLSSGNSGAGHIYVHGHTETNPKPFNGSSGRYLVMKIRSSGNITYRIELATSGSGRYNSGFKASSNDWQVVVIDLATYAPNYSVEDLNTDGFVFRITSSAGTVGTDRIDIAYMAVVDDLNEAKTIIGEEKTYQYYAKGTAWTASGKTISASTMSCSGECVPTVLEIQQNNSKLYEYSCSVCGKKYGNDRTVGAEVDRFYSALSLYNNYNVKDTSSVKSDGVDGEVFARLYSHGSAENNGYNQAYLSGSTTGGRYLVVKYRMPKVDTVFTTQRMYISHADSSDATASTGNQITYTIQQDGNWHTAVIDIRGYKSTQSATSVTKEILFRPLSTSDANEGTVNDYIDIAYVAICNSTDDFAGLIDQETYELHTSSTNSNELNSADSTCAKQHRYVESGSDKAYVYTCSYCSKVADFDVDRYFSSDALYDMGKFQLDNAKGYDETEDLNFVRYTGQGKAGQVNYFRRKTNYSYDSNGNVVTETFCVRDPFNVGNGKKYLTIMYRTNDTTWSHYMWLGTKDANTLKKVSDTEYTGAVNDVSVQLPLTKLKANEWTLLVIDLEKALGSKWVAASNGDYVIESLLFHANNVPVGTTFDVSYIAIVDTIEDAQAVARGADKALLINASDSGEEINLNANYTLSTSDLNKNEPFNMTKLLTTDDATGISFIRYTGKDGAGQANYFRHPVNPNGDGTADEKFSTSIPFNVGHGKYLTVMYRTNDTTWSHYMFLGTKDANTVKYNQSAGKWEGSSNRVTLQLPVSSLRVNTWTLLVIDLEKVLGSKWIPNANGDYIMENLCFHANSVPSNVTFDVSYMVFTDTLEDIKKVTGISEIVYVSGNNSGAYGNLDDNCPGSEIGHVTDTLDCTTAAYCKFCGVKMRDAVDHVYDSMVLSSQYLATRATDTERGTYYYACRCGARGNETYVYGKTLAEMTDLTKSDRYDTLVSGISANNLEKFLFFTDPHPISAGEIGSMVTSYEYHIDLMAKHFTDSELSFVLSGGDWLYDSNTKENAIANLTDIDNRMQAAFGKNYYMIVGNHDYNYQAKNESGSIGAGTHRLTREEMVSTWYSDARYGGHAYYSFSGTNTKFYVFDSETDWEHPNTETVTAYDKEQIIWFLEQLSANNDAHIALAPHILYSSGTTLHGGTAKLLEFSEVYNNRGSVTYEGKTYDFSGKTGRVEFLIAGHTHKDVVEYYNGIPCVLTVNAATGAYPKFDMVAVDYATRTLYTVRVGEDTVENLEKLDRVIALDKTE